MYNRPAPDLYGLLPDHLRNRDAEEGRPLQALMQLLAAELQLVEQDVDQLYDNWFIESCEQWVIPYLAELVGAQPLHVFGRNEGGIRSYVANILGYRQAKGTAAAIEQIARDATGWPVLSVEFFLKLATSQHLNHIRPEATAFASIRNAEAARQAHLPFDSMCHAAGVGDVVGFAGRFNIPNVGLMIWRIDSYPLGFLISEPLGYLGGPPPRASTLGPGLRHFDRLGRDSPLYNVPKADISIAGRVSERVVPAPLDRRIIHRDLEMFKHSLWFDDEPVLRIRLDGQMVAPEKQCCCSLESWLDGNGDAKWRRPAASGEICFDPELGRISLHASDETKSVETSYSYGAAFDTGGGPYDRTDSAESWVGGWFVDGQVQPWLAGVAQRAQDPNLPLPYDGIVHPTLAAAIQAWNGAAMPGMRGVITILDNATYSENLTTQNNVIRIPPGAKLAIVSAAKPIRAAADIGFATGCWPHISSHLAVRGELGGVNDDPGLLLLDGLLVEGELRVRDGGLGRLTVRHSTLGASAAGLNGGVDVQAGNEGLSVELVSTIAGQVRMNSAAGGLIIADSIIGADIDLSRNPKMLPKLVSASNADADIRNSTIFGQSEARSIEAANSIFMGVAKAMQRQRGCVRFCYAPVHSRLARKFRCQPELSFDVAAVPGIPLSLAQQLEIDRAVRPVFKSVRWGDPAFAQLALGSPQVIRTGADGGAEMGIGFALGEPFRNQNLKDVLAEFLPFGLTAAPIFIS
jgi:hypothetical protein